MGCVGSKKEEDAPGKRMENHERQQQAQTAHYVKDPTTGNPASKFVSRVKTTTKTSHEGIKKKARRYRTYM